MSYKITELNEEQEAGLEKVRDEWLAIGLSTDASEREKAEAAVKLAYKCAGLDMPSNFAFYWADNPDTGCHMVAEMYLKEEKGVKNPTEEQIKEEKREQLSNACLGSQEAGWLSFYDFFRQYVPEVEGLEILDGLVEVAKNVGWWWPYDDRAILTERPLAIHLDDQNRLHNAEGPAVAYRGDWNVYAWHGIQIEDRLIEQPETITVDEIENEENQELRRIKLEIFGEARFLEESGAEILDEDLYGTLYRKVLPNARDEEPIVMVRVVNSTPEPDGTKKIYWLRVPPDTKTAHEAVAWTFGMTTEQYKPVAES